MTLIIPTTGTALGTGFINLVTDDVYIVQSGLTISGDGGDKLFYADLAQTNVNIAVYGNLFQGTLFGIVLESVNSSVVIGETGVVSAYGAGGGSAALRLKGNGTSVTNDGAIWATGVGIAIEAANDVVIGNTGSVIGARFEGLNVLGTNARILNSGYVQGGSSAVYLNGTGGMIENSGEIVGANVGLQFGDNSILLNSGRITTSKPTNAVTAVACLGSAQIDNTGTIQGYQSGIMAAGLGGGQMVSNSGTISTPGANGVALGLNWGTVRNSGDIMGSVNFGSNVIRSEVINSGHITGSIQFSSAGGTYIDQGGTLTGKIQGNSGNDYFTLRSANIEISDSNTTTDLDIVTAFVSYELGTGIEALVLRQGAITGTGNVQANTITGSHRANILNGLAGADTIAGGNGADSLFGGTDNDSLSGGDEGDLLDGGAGIDILNGDEGDDVLRGRFGTDSLYGGNDEDLLVGGNGADTLYGGAGDDTLVGSNGRDWLNGGTERDSYVFGPGDIGNTTLTRDTIATFVSGQDVIDLARLDADTTTSGDDAFVFIGTAGFTLGVEGQLHVVILSGATVLEGDTDGDTLADVQITLSGVLPTAVAAMDLIL